MKNRAPPAQAGQKKQQLSDPSAVDQGRRRSHVGGARRTKLRSRGAASYGALLLMATLAHRSMAAGLFKVRAG